VRARGTMEQWFDGVNELQMFAAEREVK